MRCCALAVGLVAVIPGTAQAAQARFRVPSGDSGVLRESLSLRTAFTLPGSFSVIRSPLSGSVIRGEYACLRMLPGGARQSVVLAVSGRAQRARPRVLNGVVSWVEGRFRIERKGHEGPLRWYAGSDGRVEMAIAFRRMPRGFEAGGRRYAFFAVRVDPNSPAAGDGRRCSSAPDDVTVGRVVRTVDVVRATS